MPEASGAATDTASAVFMVDYFCVAGIVICFQAFNMPQFSGDRLTAVAALLGLFGLASLPLTYFLHFMFAVSHMHSLSSALRLLLHLLLMPACLTLHQQMPVLSSHAYPWFVALLNSAIMSAGP